MPSRSGTADLFLYAVIVWLVLTVAAIAAYAVLR
jgi:hypothetical protein